MYLIGYDGVPVEGMANLDIGSNNNHAHTNGTIPSTPTAAADNLNFDPDPVPSPPQDNNQVAAWYDTDL